MRWSITSLAAVIALVWLLVRAAHEGWTRTRSRRQKTTTNAGFRQLSMRSAGAVSDRECDAPETSPLRGQLGWFWLVFAYHFNDNGPDQLLFRNRSTRKSSRKIHQARRLLSLNVLYTLGAIGVLLSFLAIPAYLLFELYLSLIGTDKAIALSGVSNATPSGLLVPGLTVPLRDWSTLLLASFVAIVWHEAGHAITAIIAQVNIESFAFILIFAFPGAYVALDSASFDSLPSASARLRIITAGIWHNFILCMFISLGIWIGILGRNSGVYRYLGYTDINEYGVLVQLVAEGSPLSGLLVPQQLVTHLDDVELHDSHLYGHWDNYLWSDSIEGQNYDSLGYCIDRDMYTSRPVICCANNVTSTAKPTRHAEERQVCYLAANQIDENTSSDPKPDKHILQGHCFDPGELLSFSRCTASCDQKDQICIHPSPSAHLLRITVRNTSNGEEEVIMYRGDKRQLWHNVKVGRYLAPWGLVQSFPVDIETFWLYTSSISLSLALFNLLPLPRLDGGEILDTLLSPSISGFAPVLPLVNDNRYMASLHSGKDKEGKLDRILENSVTVLQNILLAGGHDTRQDHQQRRKNYLRIMIQGVIAMLAVLNFASNVRRQAYD